MNDEDLDRREGATSCDGDESPAIVAYDPHFPAARPEAEDRRALRFDPHFASDGSSDFD